MGEALRSTFGVGRGNGAAASRWLWHHQLKKPFFGRFMKPWRWPDGLAVAGWERLAIDSASGSRLVALMQLAPRGRGVVVCAHPMGLAAKGFWLRHGHAQALLEAGYHVVAFDFNGFGESPSTNFDYPLDVIAQVVTAGQRVGAIRDGQPNLLAAIAMGCVLRPIIVSQLAQPGSLDLLATDVHDQVISDAGWAALARP